MFYENLKKECDKQGIALSRVVVECGGKTGSINGWKKGATPNSKIVMQLSLRLNVSTDYLLFGKEKIKSSLKVEPNMISLSKDQKRLLEMYELLTDMEKGEILGELKIMTKNRKSINKENAI